MLKVRFAIAKAVFVICWCPYLHFLCKYNNSSSNNKNINIENPYVMMRFWYWLMIIVRGTEGAKRKLNICGGDVFRCPEWGCPQGCSTLFRLRDCPAGHNLDATTGSKTIAITHAEVSGLHDEKLTHRNPTQRKWEHQNGDEFKQVPAKNSKTPILTSTFSLLKAVLHTWHDNFA